MLTTHVRPGQNALELMDRPARLQVDEVADAEKYAYTEEDSGHFNVWFGKGYGNRDHGTDAAAMTRCIPHLDVGKTKAKKDTYICLYFAQGRCTKGPKCMYAHRVPTTEDEKKLNSKQDIFGRSRAADKSGGGGDGFMDSKTLYVGKVSVRSRTERQMDKVIRKHFGDFGPLERVKVLPHREIAFVTYCWRVSAEFAKEAMSEQALDHNEAINIRWAEDDPNPQTMALMQQRREMNRFNSELGVRTGAEPGPGEPNFEEYWGKRARMLEDDDGEEMGPALKKQKTTHGMSPFDAYYTVYPEKFTEHLKQQQEWEAAWGQYYSENREYFAQKAKEEEEIAAAAKKAEEQAELDYYKHRAVMEAELYQKQQEEKLAAEERNPPKNIGPSKPQPLGEAPEDWDAFKSLVEVDDDEDEEIPNTT